MASSASRQSTSNSQISSEPNPAPTSVHKKQSRRSKTRQLRREGICHLTEARKMFEAGNWSAAFGSMKFADPLLHSGHRERDGLNELFKDVSLKLLESKDYELAWEALTSAQMFYPDVVFQKKIEVIKHYFMDNNSAKAVEKSMELTGENPASGQAWLQRAEIHAALFDWDAAIGALEICMRAETPEIVGENTIAAGFLSYCKEEKAAVHELGVQGTYQGGVDLIASLGEPSELEPLKVESGEEEAPLTAAVTVDMLIHTCSPAADKEAVTLATIKSTCNEALVDAQTIVGPSQGGANAVESVTGKQSVANAVVHNNQEGNRLADNAVTGTKPCGVAHSLTPEDKPPVHELGALESVEGTSQGGVAASVASELTELKEPEANGLEAQCVAAAPANMAFCQYSAAHTADMEAITAPRDESACTQELADANSIVGPSHRGADAVYSATANPSASLTAAAHGLEMNHLSVSDNADGLLKVEQEEGPRAITFSLTSQDEAQELHELGGDQSVQGTSLDGVAADVASELAALDETLVSNVNVEETMETGSDGAPPSMATAPAHLLPPLTLKNAAKGVNLLLHTAFFYGFFNGVVFVRLCAMATKACVGVDSGIVSWAAELVEFGCKKVESLVFGSAKIFDRVIDILV